jgi:hypothetical protein
MDVKLNKNFASCLNGNSVNSELWFKNLKQSTTDSCVGFAINAEGAGLVTVDCMATLSLLCEVLI